ncbi:MAG: undecaprenyl-diphosphate phosphatase [Phycisphaerae bacterium]|nr:undecaprenyl-diphosphate phosphatase [Phycisphaerae bacterium]
MHLFHAIILGLVEGITEFLPVSSTGHLILTSALLGLDTTPERKAAVDAFNIVIQGGAILAVAGLYWPRVASMLRGIVGGDRDGARLLVNLIVAFLPAALLGPLLDDFIEERLFRPWPVLIALLLGGVWMIWIDRWRRRNDSLGERPSLLPGGDTIDRMTPVQALGIGLFQCVAMWPGTSRSMMTIAGGTMLGLRPREAAEFSFLLGLPTLGAACLYKLVKNLKHASDTGTPNLFETLGVLNVIVGVVIAMISAAIAIRWLVGFLNRHGLSVFGVYRIVLFLILASLVLSGAVHIG